MDINNILNRRITLCDILIEGQITRVLWKTSEYHVQM